MDKCVICGEKQTRLKTFWSGGRDDFYGEFVCSKCMSKAGSVLDERFHSKEEAITVVRKCIQDAPTFNLTRKVEHFIQIDENNKLIKIEDDEIFKFSDVLSYDFMSDGKTVKKGGASKAVSNAIVGGVLFGGVGAIAGAAMGLPKNKEQCTSMKIIVTLRKKDAFNITKTIHILSIPSKVDGLLYKGALINAQDCIDVLDEIIKNNEKNQGT